MFIWQLDDWNELKYLIVNHVSTGLGFVWMFSWRFQTLSAFAKSFIETIIVKYLSTLSLELRSELPKCEQLQDQLILSLRFYISTRTTRTTLCQIASLPLGNNTSLSTILFPTADTWSPAWLPHLITKVQQTASIFFSSSAMLNFKTILNTVHSI